MGLRTEIILNLALLMTGAMLLVGFSIMKIHERDILKQKVRNGRLILKSIQDSIDLQGIGKADFSDRAYLFHRLVQVYADPREIEEIAIVDPSQQVIASSLEGRGAKRINDADMTRAISDRTGIWKFDRDDSFLFGTYRDLNLFSPLFREGELVGAVYVRLSLADVMKGIIRSQRLIILLVMLDGLVILIFGSFLLSRVIVNPLKTLVRATEGITRGEYDQRIGVTEGNEIGKLADSFNQMTARLRESQRSVQEYVRSLEAANERLQRTQMELTRSEKLASIGRFAAGVAHEVGNPLGAILGYTSILQEFLDDGSDGLEYLSRIEVEIQRINKIIRELLDFSRPSVVEIKDVDLNGVIEDCLSLLSFQKSFKNITSVLELKKGLPPVQVDQSQIQQVFVNLIINAVDAMPDGGTLTVKTDDHIFQKAHNAEDDGYRRRKGDPTDSDYTHLRRSHMAEHPLNRGAHVVAASVIDTGCGIAPDDLEKIFDPFFTTKDPDKGTGLGLSISMRILESFRGRIEVESQPGGGSTFRILLPVHKS
ncbi:MAG: HAMP domain-containing protein [Proteobacteria bacterium]|nr:HAMP domain-containing protein [Pseudomonadota bacterium]